jgi:hypothetical protein
MVAQSWQKIDLHIHTTFSDGSLSVAEVVDFYGQRGYGAIAITDHLSEKTGVIGRVTHHLGMTLSQDNFAEYLATIRREACRAQEQYGMLVIPGFEITKNSFRNSRSAHFLVLGVEHYLSPDQDVEVILKQAKALGGFTVAAHPFHTGEFEFQSFYLWSRREELAPLIDAWEINYRTQVYETIFNSNWPKLASSTAPNITTHGTPLYLKRLNRQKSLNRFETVRLNFFKQKLATL